VLTRELEALRTQREDMVHGVLAAVTAQAEAAERAAAKGRLQHYRLKITTLREQAALLLGEAPDDLSAGLRAAIAQHDDAVSGITMEIGADEARLKSAREAISSLESPAAICPTCQRPLSDHERGSAKALHAATVEAIREALNRNRAALADMHKRGQRLHVLLADIDRLGPEPEARANHEIDPSADPAGVIEASRELERQISEREGALAEVERSLTAAASTEQEAASHFKEIRREAVAQMTADLMTRTVKSLMTERVAPIRDEVSARWKQVFGDRGTIQMTSAGVISMELNGQTIEFSDFSPGEQVVAMLALQFITVAASTTSPFMLLDEPLESLDPPNRRLIASVLAGADRPVEQMIVTTYEDALVRRLHATTPDVDVRIIG
jgi:DNA repair exonuclease SbcCD ATPase subunit